MEILNTMVSVFGVIGLGAMLARVGFLTETLTEGLNRIVYYIALPALLMRACAHARAPDATGWVPLVAVAAPTVGLAILARMLRLEGPLARAFVVTAFFGNLTYIGLPVIMHGIGLVKTLDRPEVVVGTVIVIMLMNIAYNVIALCMFQQGGIGAVRLAQRIALNPIVLAGVTGLALTLFGVALPEPFEFTLASLGGLAVPAALLCNPRARRGNLAPLALGAEHSA